MSAPAITGPGRPTLRLRGTPYPVLLPSMRDPRLHLAAVIVSLQVLGQTAFDFRLSIAQILVSLLTCAVLEMGIALRRQKVILWPASALLTGNGVAFILRVPGTEHGDWWSVHGWWVFAGTAAVALLSKHLIQWRGRHLFNPSNIGLVLCFLLLGPELADPLEFWWGPMSGWLALALAIIVAGGFAILRRLRLLGIALAFWVTFAGSLALLAASGHAMSARWHLGPVSDWHFWRVLAFSPEILVFLFFMITDPKTIPGSRAGRLGYAVSLGLLAALLIAPQRDEFGSKVAVLASLAIVCAAWPLVGVLARRLRVPAVPRAALGVAAVVGVVALGGLVVLAGAPARSSAAEAAAPFAPAALPRVTILPVEGVVPVDRPTATRIARHLVADLGSGADALRRRDRGAAATGATGARLASLWRSLSDAGSGPIVVPEYRVRHVSIALEPSEGQAPPTVVAKASGTVERATYAGSPPAATRRATPTAFVETFELSLQEGRYLIAASRGASDPPVPTSLLNGVQLHDVAAQAGLDFRHGAFRFGVSGDPPAMMGGGLCWLDYDDDGWLDLYAVNSYADDDLAHWDERGGRPRAALFHNVRGRFENVSRGSGADLVLRGSGCVAADFNLDGHTDLYVTTTGYNVLTDGYDALLWGRGDGTFAEGAHAAGITAPGWHSGAAVADVNLDGLPDLFVAGYTDMNAPIASAAGFPTSHRPVRDRLYLNRGPDERGRSRFREVGRAAGLEPRTAEHGLGAVFTDADGDGRIDLYVANDADPNRLYLNVARPGTALGFRLEERASDEGLADANAGMGIAAGDYSRDGREDLFVSNSREQLHAAFRSAGSRPGSRFADARPDFVAALGKTFTGWGVSWADLDLDGDLDLVLANGAIPVTNLKRNAERVQVLENRGSGDFANARALAGGLANRPLNGRGLAAADYDNDGDVDLAVGVIGGPLVLLRNTGASGHWLEVDVSPFAPGATVTAILDDGRRLVRRVHAGSSYLSSEDPRVHFGLGRATTVRELVVRAPGRVTRLRNLRADRLVTVTP